MYQTHPSIEEFRTEARTWLAANASPRPVSTFTWGIGSDSVAIYPTYRGEEEIERYRRERTWQATKYDAGWGAITWPTELGGRDLDQRFATAFAEEEERFDVPARSRLFGVTVSLVAPIVQRWGTSEQRELLVRPLLRNDVMACQLFSEPNAGSDLASVTTHAEPRGEGWVVRGQKVWTSGAHVADYGLAICRTDPSAPKHAGLTAFLIPMSADGVTIRPIRQMTGGATFNEVFLDDVRVPDELRLGGVGEGWKVALGTLSSERGFNPAVAGPGLVVRLRAMAAHLGNSDPIVRHHLAGLYAETRTLELTAARVRAALESGRTAGPEGSIGKLAWNRVHALANQLIGEILGARLVVETGEWGTSAWTEYLMGCAALRIAGGTDEIQHNILAERILGLPKEPSAAKG